MQKPSLLQIPLMIKTRSESFLISIFSWLCFLGFLEFWFWHRTHLFSLSSVGVLSVISAVCLIFGNFFTQKIPLPRLLQQQKPFQLAIGYLIFSALLFVITILGLLNIMTSFWLLVAGSFLILGKNMLKPDDSASPLTLQEALPGLLCLILSGLGATLWCLDALSIPINDGHFLFFPIWQDSFSHARSISSFAQADGLHMLSDFRACEVALRLYHYTPYWIPAVVVTTTHASAYEIFSCFLIPVGIFLSGLAAFSLATSVWGIWPGLAATIAVVFLPDAYQQGFQNKFLSYHFLQQVGPTGLYGTACTALAWVFILGGCREKKLLLLMSGYFFLALTVIFKAQFFVANAFLILIYPCFFGLHWKKRWRLFLACLFTLLFCSVISISQHLPSIPLIRLDGSSLHTYAGALSNFINPGKLHDFLLEKFVTHPFLSPWYQAGAAIMIFFCTLGIWGMFCLITIFYFHRRLRLPALLLPIVIIVNYLIMSLGLAYDSNHIGCPEELIHRPFVWAYFAVATWTSGGLYFLFFGNQWPKKLHHRLVCLFILASSLLTPLFFAHGIQTMPLWGKTLTSNAIAVEMMEAINYIRSHSAPYEIVQDSEQDPCFIVTGLTERQAYAVLPQADLHASPPPVLIARCKELENFKQMKTNEELSLFLKSHPIEWYLLHPSTKVDWPEPFKSNFIFKSGGYRVYHWVQK